MPVFYLIGNCASTVVGVKKNCLTILAIVAAGRRFFILHIIGFGYKKLRMDCSIDFLRGGMM